MINCPSKVNSPRTPSVEDRLSVKERLALIGLIDEGVRQGSTESPLAADLFNDLLNLVDATVSGAKVDRLKSGDSHNGFKVIEINAETGENLGRLHMLYLNKPIPCYYLVYVEVAAPYRNKGLGNRILKAFRDVLEEKGAVGILDNIIPDDDPTFDIYLKLNWKPAAAMMGEGPAESDRSYMIYIPSNMASKDLKDPILKLVHHLERKRHAIDMRDNELMVKRTIEEFKDLYSALMIYFGDRIRSGEADAFVRFMFTRFVTKLLGFRRRIGQLLGYTGGESLEQIVLDPEVRSLPVQSYAPRELASKPYFVTGDRELWLHLPEVLKKHPARIIESLPNYRRPSLLRWLSEQGRLSSDTLNIGDLMDLGFDPTRLKEIRIGETDLIFERLQARLLPEVEQRKDCLERLAPQMLTYRLKNTRLAANPPLLVIRDRGNAYVLRRKVDGIHWEEALDQLQSSPNLRALTQSLGLERILTATVRRAVQWFQSRLSGDEGHLLDRASYFVAWNLETNQPKITVDFSGSFLECIWIA